MEALFSHPVYGSSFEGYVIENLLSHLPRWRASYYRTSNGAEIDLILERGRQRMAIEIKASSSPKLSRGNWSALETIEADHAYVIAPVEVSYPLADQVTVLSLAQAVDLFK